MSATEPHQVGGDSKMEEADRTGTPDKPQSISEHDKFEENASSKPSHTLEPPSDPDCTNQEPQVELDEKSDVKQMAQRKKRRVIIKTTPRKSKWNVDNIMIDSKSPLATCDLRTVLSHPMAWEALDANDRAEVLALFPDQEHIAEPAPGDRRPNFQTLLNDDSFRHDCAAYTENVAEGRHDPEWLAQAWAAHERRKAGEFDEYLVKKFEDDWQVKLPDEMKPQRAALSTAATVEAKGTEEDGQNTGDKMQE